METKDCPVQSENDDLITLLNIKNDIAATLHRYYEDIHAIKTYKEVDLNGIIEIASKLTDAKFGTAVWRYGLNPNEPDTGTETKLVDENLADKLNNEAPTIDGIISSQPAAKKIDSNVVVPSELIMPISLMKRKHDMLLQISTAATTDTAAADQMQIDSQPQNLFNSFAEKKLRTANINFNASDSDDSDAE